MWKTQRNWSKNSGESRSTRWRRYFWAAVLWTRAVRVGLRAMRKPQIGSRVWYRGGLYVIGNGVCSESWSIWPVWNRGGTVHVEYAPRAECREVRTPRELWLRFSGIYRWWMTSWHGIEVNRRMQPDQP